MGVTTEEKYDVGSCIWDECGAQMDAIRRTRATSAKAWDEWFLRCQKDPGHTRKLTEAQYKEL